MLYPGLAATFSYVHHSVITGDPGECYSLASLSLWPFAWRSLLLKISPHSARMLGCGPKALKETLISFGWLLAFPGLKPHPHFFQYLPLWSHAPLGVCLSSTRALVMSTKVPLDHPHVILNLITSARSISQTGSH